MKSKIALLLASASLAATGLAHADGAKLYVEKTCTACHGKDARTPLLPQYPRIRGQSAAYIERQMLDIKSGARANGNSAAMKGIMGLVSDAEIKQLADYLSKLTP